MPISGPYLVAGAAGFIGFRFIESCKIKGIPVISVDKLRNFTARPEHLGTDFGTIVDREELWSWLNQTNPPISTIIHLGACTNTTEMNEELLRRMNLEYSQKLWEYAATHRIPFVYASSAATYGDGSLGYDDKENLIAQLKPLNPYGESKRLFDLWALDQEHLSKAPPTWAGFKFFNVYGYGERHKNKMASVILHAYDQILSTGKVSLFKSHKDGIADGHQKRDFVSVEDTVQVLHMALERPILRGIFNLGTGQARTFLDLVHAVFKAMNRPAEIEFIDTPVELRSRYQYFTEAKMDRLRKEGCKIQFQSLEEGVSAYIKRLVAR